MKQFKKWDLFFIRFYREQHGDTLIEGIVSVALFAVVAVFVCTVLMLSLSVISRARGNTKGGMTAAGGVAQQTTMGTGSTSGASVSTVSGTMVFSDGTNSYTVSGSYVKGTASAGVDNSVTYYTFVPQ
ncbi:MAG: hypothetical protein ABF449_09985 [Ethanoligenens sp.]|uniref:hypothetical protein n=1 Tax=Ethanoligenens sp. TaxID=2099655 RepID=UPI0039EA1478